MKLAEGLDDATAICHKHLGLRSSYSKVDEYHIAHDHVNLAVENIRQVGDRRLLALTTYDHRPAGYSRPLNSHDREQCGIRLPSNRSSSGRGAYGKWQ